MVKGRILAIDHDRDALTVLKVHLETEAYEVLATTRGEAGLEGAYRLLPDLVLIDPALPDMDGLDVCRHIRLNPRTARLPVIVVTARSTEADRVLALEAGADDIVTAPFSLRELTARIHAVLRRARPAAETPTFIDLGDLTVDLIRYEVRFRGKPIFLTATEFRVLQTLALRAGKIVTRSELTAARRGRALADDPGLDVHVASIRKKLKAGRDLIRIIHGFGFRLDAQGVPGQTGIEPYITEPEQPPIPIVDQRRTG